MNIRGAWLWSELCGSECSRLIRPSAGQARSNWRKQEWSVHPQAKVTLGTHARGGLVTSLWGPQEMTGGHVYGRTSKASHDIRGVVGGPYPIHGPLGKSLGATRQPGYYANIAAHPILADLHAVLCHYIRSLLEELDIPFKEFSLPQQRLFHQLLEKHLLMFVTSPEDYGFN